MHYAGFQNGLELQRVVLVHLLIHRGSLGSQRGLIVLGRCRSRRGTVGRLVIELAAIRVAHAVVIVLLDEDAFQIEVGQIIGVGRLGCRGSI